MQADRANSGDDENGPHEEDEAEGMVFPGFQQAEISRRTGCANGRSRCDEALGLPHPPTASL
jgi:hypothetical protein